jgi:hypothetical protein
MLANGAEQGNESRAGAPGSFVSANCPIRLRVRTESDLCKRVRWAQIIA